MADQSGKLDISSLTVDEKDKMLFELWTSKENKRLKSLPKKREYNNKRRSNPEVHRQDIESTKRWFRKKYHEDEEYRERIKADRRRQYHERQARKKKEAEEQKNIKIEKMDVLGIEPEDLKSFEYDN